MATPARRWVRNPLAPIPTEELVDEEQHVMANVSPMPDGTHVVSVSIVVRDGPAEARTFAERLFDQLRGAA